MGVNRGKDFENQVRKDFEKIPEVSIDRLHDQTSGFKGSSNICDLIVYRYPYQWYIECKTCYGNTLNFHNITDKQWNGLLEKSLINGVIAGYLIWFIDHDLTVFVTANAMEILRLSNHKSLNAKTFTGYLGNADYRIIDSEKRRVLFNYDFWELFWWGDAVYG